MQQKQAQRIEQVFEQQDEDDESTREALEAGLEAIEYYKTRISVLEGELAEARNTTVDTSGCTFGPGWWVAFILAVGVVLKAYCLPPQSPKSPHHRITAIRQ